MAEWFKAHAWRACGDRKVAPEFESLPLRKFFPIRKKFTDASRALIGPTRAVVSEAPLKHKILEEMAESPVRPPRRSRKIWTSMTFGLKH